MIPQIIHRIWVGETPMPEEFVRYGESWKEHNPGFGFLLWQDGKLPPMKNRHLYDAATVMAEKSDILRLELLYKYGGVYVDTDFECFKPIKPLIEGKSALISSMDRVPCSTGFMAFAPKDPFILDCIESLPAHLDEYRRGKGSEHQANQKTGPSYVNEIFKRYSHVEQIEEKYLYPYDHKDKASVELWKKEGIAAFPDAYAAHHWAGSWVKKKKV